MMPLLEVRELTKYFDLSGDVLGRLFHGQKILKAVDGVNFSIHEGQTLGLVGESGCGKSTTARLITRLIPATGGQVCFQEREILSLPKRAVREIRKDIQMVFQDPYASLNPRMTVLQTVGRPMTLYYGIQGRKRVDQTVELLELVGLSADSLQRYPHEFSGGQRQRIGIARALAARPRLLIADEPVSSLDVSVQAQVLNLFKKLQKELKLTMLFISHDLNVVEYLADVVAVMYAGKIVETAPVEEIFKLPLHPYTQGLVSSNPSPNSFMEKKRPTLRGEVLFPLNPPGGCRLEPRCPIKVLRCKSVEPVLEEKRGSHWAACHELQPQWRQLRGEP
jgi:oligopeptide/dipeptide ABC transporter ATP-binding protein